MEEIKLLTWNGQRERPVPSFMQNFQSVGRAWRDSGDNPKFFVDFDAPAFIPDEEAERLSALFRSTHPDLVRFWRQSEVAQRMTAERVEVLRAAGGHFVQGECLMPHPNWIAGSSWAHASREQILADIEATRAMLLQSLPYGDFSEPKNLRTSWPLPKTPKTGEPDAPPESVCRPTWLGTIPRKHRKG